CMESGYAATLAEIISELVPESNRVGLRPRQVNVLAGPMLTPGDLEHLRDLIEWFGLRAVFVPDVSDSLDGHLTDSDFSPITVGGTPLPELQGLGEAVATLAVGASMRKAAEILQQRTQVPTYSFDHLYGLHATDDLIMALAAISAMPVPQRIERQRAQLQDAMVDTHFMLGFLRVAIAADPDQLNAFAHLIHEMGGQTVVAVAAGDGPALAKLPVASVKIGDLEDMETLARDNKAELIIGNSHAVQSAERLGLPILRCGFPLYDVVGGYQKTFIGYAGSRQTLFDLSNLALSNNHIHEVPMYRSIYAQKPAEESSFHPPLEATAHGAYPTHAH
ncbi:MAG: nitrogenase iron-molybdenum cofactor biosynthesis protein NifN, partial [Candidatus Methylumidiphilus sp.]